MELNAKNLKDELWKVLRDIKAKKIEAADAEAIASQSREIIRVIRAQQSILKQASEKVTEELLSFAGK